MEYTQGKWVHYSNKIEVHGKGIIAICPSPTNDKGVLEFIANAHLIAAAINACQKVNPDNPMAVAESISELYEACKATDKYFRACVKAWARGDRMMPGDTESVRVSSDSLDKLCDEAAPLIFRAVARAEGKNG